MKHCKNCLSIDFYINEGLAYKAELDNGELTVYKLQASEIENINCSKCGATYSESAFKQINF